MTTTRTAVATAEPPQGWLACWTTRNGQKIWDGPFRTKREAEHYLTRLLDRSGGSFVGRTP